MTKSPKFEDEAFIVKDLIVQGDKNLGHKRGFFSGFSKSNVEKPFNLYQRAANIFVSLENWEEAGKAFEKIAILQQINRDFIEAAENFVKASYYYGEVNSPEAIFCLLKASDIQIDNGDFELATDTHKTIQRYYRAFAVEHKTSQLENSITNSWNHVILATEYFQEDYKKKVSFKIN
jgi:tetratricopeptide (TPR) repeat protein